MCHFEMVYLERKKERKREGQTMLNYNFIPFSISYIIICSQISIILIHSLLTGMN